MTWRVNEQTAQPSARRAGSHNWQSRWSHKLGRKPLRAVPCSWQATFKSTPLAEGYDEIVVPWEREMRHAEQVDRDGLRLPTRTLTDLVHLGEELGVQASFHL